MPLVIQKYGGSSLATPKHIQRAAKRIRDLKTSGSDVVVVASAMGHTTDHLMRLAKKTAVRPASRELDMLLTAGERVSMSLLAMCLAELGVAAISFTGSQSGILTTSEHTQAKILEIRPQRIQEELAKGKVVIIAGFQGVSREKEITTLGRGGSDTTAVALAATLKADLCEILTDVEGLFSADPRIVKNARLMPRCSYEESLELARLGAKMQARSIELAKRFQVRVRIASSQEGKRLYTEIGEFPQEPEMERTLIRGIATKDGYHFFEAELTLKELLSEMEILKLPLQFFGASGRNLSFLCEEDNASSVREALKGLGVEFQEVPKVCLVSAVGEGVTSSSRVLPILLAAIEETGTEVLLVTSNALSLSAAVASKAKKDLAERLHQRLIESPVV